MLLEMVASAAELQILKKIAGLFDNFSNERKHCLPHHNKKVLKLY